FVCLLLDCSSVISDFLSFPTRRSSDLSRSALRDDRLCGREVKRGDTVIVPIYALHRHHQLWDDPDAFYPERFENRKDIKRYAYLDRKSTRLNSSHVKISYAVFCLKKK